MNAITCMTWMKKGLEEWIPQQMQNDGPPSQKFLRGEEEDDDDEDEGNLRTQIDWFACPCDVININFSEKQMLIDFIQFINLKKLL